MSVNGVAVIGMAGRFPGSMDVSKFWAGVRSGRVMTTRPSAEWLLALPGADVLLAQQDYVPVEGLMPDPDAFDHQFFGFARQDAVRLDPQVRWMLQESWHALEDACCDPTRFRGRIGVFVGSATSQHFASSESQIWSPLLPDLEHSIALDPDFVATMIAYKIGLTGPAVNVRTACSSSLVSVHLAAQSLLSGECDLALAGGVSIRGSRWPGYRYTPDGILSPDGGCRPFDASASGTVPGNGVGVVTLRRLDDALAEDDHIHAVLAGSAINNDGRDKVGFTAPGEHGQQAVMHEALGFAGLPPERVGYIETHGTGTRLGDPIEYRALVSVYGRSGTAPACRLGAVKANIGHLNTAAGVAGLINAVHVVREGYLPPIAGFRKASPLLCPADGGLVLSAAPASWAPADGPRAAAVSSFGIGGTNAHVLLEQAPARTSASAPERPRVFFLSARSTAAAGRQAAALRQWLVTDGATADPAAVAATLDRGRQVLPFRQAVVADSVARLCELLAPKPGAAAVERSRQPPRVAFVLPGQGAHPGALAESLGLRFPGFRNDVEHGCEIVRQAAGPDLEPVLLGGAAADEGPLDRTTVAQPALFIVCHALACLLRRLGLESSALIGHSLGEYVAATLAGLWSYDDALALVTERGRLQQACPAGAMLAVGAGPSELPALLEGLSLAAANAPGQSVVSGPEEAVAAYEAALHAVKLPAKRLDTSRAFHSRLIEPSLPGLRAALERLRFGRVAIPLYSTLTGRRTTAAELANPQHWLTHARDTVRFESALRAAVGDGACLILDLSPGAALSGPIGESVSGLDATVIPCLRDADAATSVLRAAAQAWTQGIDIRSDIDDPPVPRISLPGYPFEPVLLQPDEPVEPQPVTSVPAAGLYQVEWKPLRATGGRTRNPGPILVVTDDQEVADSLTPSLDGCALLDAGEDLAPHAWETACTELRNQAAGARPTIIFAVGLHERELQACRIPRGASALLALAKALGRIGLSADLKILVRGATGAASTAPECPVQAAVAGIARVIPQEFAQLTCQVVDTAPQASPDEIADAACRRLSLEDPATLVAYRDGVWAPAFKPMPAAHQTSTGAFRQGGNYVVVGGANGVGYQTARWLGRTYQGNIAVLEWSADGTPIAPSMTVENRAELSASAASLSEYSCDPTSGSAVKDALNSFVAEYGPIDGVFYAARLYDDDDGAALVDRLDDRLLLRHLTQKPVGFERLCDMMPGDDPAIRVVFSSLAAWLGGIGGAAYACANAVLAAAAARRGWQVIDWDVWKLDGRDRGRLALHDVALRPQEALRLLDEAIAAGAGRVVATGGSLHARLRQWVVQANTVAEALGTGSERPRIGGQPADGVEADIAALWHDVLGTPPADPAESFFEVGGHSLLAIRLLALLRDRFSVEIPLAGFFDTPTVTGLAAIIRSAAAPSAEKAPAPPLVALDRSQYVDRAAAPKSVVAHAESPARSPGDMPPALDFSLYYFPSTPRASGADQYSILRRSAVFADAHGFDSLWLPERHFHDFGGSFPSPAVAAAAIATLTTKIKIRAGSVVLPLHHPVQVAEEWAMIDNLSGGRVGISFAPGWSRRDYVLAPENFERRRDVLKSSLEEVRRLWRGDTVRFPGPGGEEEAVRIHPAPIQPELPFWITAAANPATFELAGTLGAGLLTHLVGQPVTELHERIAVYRTARQAAGHPGQGHVTLLVHTFLAEDERQAHDLSKPAFCQYLESFVDVVSLMSPTADRDKLSAQDIRALTERGFERFFSTESLMGTPETAAAFLNQLSALGIDEVACLVDFGITEDPVLRSLELLAELRDSAAARGRDKVKGAAS